MNLVVFAGVDVSGEAEIRDFELEAFAEEAVSGRQISMGELLVGQVLHPARDLQAQPPKIGLKKKGFEYPDSNISLIVNKYVYPDIFQSKPRIMPGLFRQN